MAQAAAVASLAAGDEILERTEAVAQERTRVIGALRGLGWDVPDSQANFYWVRASDDLRVQLLDALAQADILARGYAVDGVRITLADAAINDRVLAVLADRGRFLPGAGAAQ
jgi:histidinol-phosphate aminotransferase